MEKHDDGISCLQWIDSSMTEWINSIRADLDHAERLDADLEYFAANYLKIRPKTGALEPLVFNAAQRELHRKLEEQKAKTGKVRAVVLKARQLGISTYIGGRFFKRTIQCPGLRSVRNLSRGSD